MQKILFLTGGLGFAGKHYYKNYRNSWDKIIVFDKKTYASDLKFFKRYKRDKDKLIIGDICNYKKLYKSMPKNCYVIHFAAESHVDNSFLSSLIFTKTNTFGTHTLLEVCRLKQNKKIIIISTDEVYGETYSKKKNERSILEPTNPYSASKTSADIISQTYFKCYKMPISIIRSNNLYGEYQYIEKIIPATINAIHQSPKNKLNIHGKGLTIRNFLHVSDFASSIQTVLKKSKDGEIFNVRGKYKIKIIDLIKYLGKLHGVNISKFSKFVKDRPFNDFTYNISDKKIRSLGWFERKKFNPEIKKILKENLVLK
ncbi:MAG: dTDP-glucose 4,6-dehydratase [Euryarchaeota archaeon]|nr:dTDP-glucose 4,6-dehydratase [Euryarchaeota archaeon]|tara:strand:- start:5136 stop:6074 length:939 start_codon:yes stop_codon:yes gene_type:complete